MHAIPEKSPLSYEEALQLIQHSKEHDLSKFYSDKAEIHSKIDALETQINEFYDFLQVEGLKNHYPKHFLGEMVQLIYESSCSLEEFQTHI